MEKELKRIIEFWGEKKQQVKAIEELAELQKALCKNLIENNGSIDNITEEMADVKIMLEQLFIIFKNKTQVESIVADKITRTLNKIKV